MTFNFGLVSFALIRHFDMFVYIPTQGCSVGNFGTNCSRICSPNCKPETCRHTDGACTCASGWTGIDCTTGTF